MSLFFGFSDLLGVVNSLLGQRWGIARPVKHDVVQPLFVPVSKRAKIDMSFNKPTKCAIKAHDDAESTLTILAGLLDFRTSGTGPDVLFGRRSSK